LREYSRTEQRHPIEEFWNHSSKKPFAFYAKDTGRRAEDLNAQVMETRKKVLRKECNLTPTTLNNLALT
jgi:hypothetical protein